MPSARSAWVWGNRALSFCAALALTAGWIEAAERSLRLAPHFGKLNPDGSFALFEGIGEGFERTVTDILLQPDGKLWVLFVDKDSIAPPGAPTRLARLLPDGQVDPSFRMDPDLRFAGSTGSISSIVLQPDGKILLTGEFAVPGEERPRSFVRLQSDGTLDQVFLENTPPVRPSAELTFGPEVEPYRTYEVLKEIHTADPTGPVRKFIINLSPLSQPVKRIAVQPDGRLLVAVERRQPERRVTLLRLRSDGTLDESFRFSEEAALGEASRLLVQPDGKILITGVAFIQKSPGSVGGIFRLEPDGALDKGFPPARIEGSERNVWSMAMQEDGRILVGGSFGAVNGIPAHGLARLKPDGSVERGFQDFPEGSRVFALLPQPDGGFIAAGGFSWWKEEEPFCSGVARFLKDGTLDEAFIKNTAGGFNGSVLCLASTGRGEILAGGEFDSVAVPPAAFPQYNQCTGPGQCVAVPAILGSWDAVNVRFAEEMTRYYQARNAEIRGIWRDTPKPEVTCVDGICVAERREAP